MTIDTQAVLIFGVPATEIKDQELIDDGILQTASPWYDSERKYWIAGYIIEQVAENHSEIDFMDLHQNIAIAHVKLSNLTGLKGKLYLSTDIT